MTASATIGSITFDCSNARAVAEFWGALLDRRVAAGATEAYAELAGAPGMTFIAVPEAKTAKNRVHLDVMVEDLDAAVGRAVSLGATTAADFDEAGYRWVTLTDPDGNEFDLAVTSG